MAERLRRQYPNVQENVFSDQSIRFDSRILRPKPPIVEGHIDKCCVNNAQNVAPKISNPNTALSLLFTNRDIAGPSNETQWY